MKEVKAKVLKPKHRTTKTDGKDIGKELSHLAPTP